MENTFTVARINETGRANLASWVANLIHEPILAEEVADSLIADLDSSDPEASLVVELGRFKTRSGNPEIYIFAAGEYDLLTMNDDGDVITRHPAA